ncbi:BatD family protein [Stenotrophomonas sp. 24(2023)]|uniref:BatD family protein n=1 Tax=Stenotrophomonas sp. 24(2023) TaxID=3068324 RepID=UPI0027DF0B5D|nr:BatD family protein [Stenotrophomonas sp. 24(2023)]WMJ70337.1 BatD family protein [Stenotrophomonas sp. 24(2023)]
MTSSHYGHWVRMPARVLLALLLWLPVCALALAQAPRAWLDRTQIAQGDTVMLNIESGGDAPDYAPLQVDFALGEQTSSRQVEWRNGQLQQRMLYGVAMTPRRSGTLVVPALPVGAARTAPLQLQVTAAPGASAAGAGAGAGGEAFLETDVDDASPYVQQSVGVVVRLFFASQLASGELVLDTPQGASLQRVGDDRSDVRQVNGRRYNVVERRYLLIPERSGALRLPAARFTGRSAGGFFDDFFGRGDGRMSAIGPERVLQVRAQPAGAPQPWLPLHDLQLRYTATPGSARVGEAASVVVEAVAVGATRAQFTDLPVPDMGPGAQVFAEPAQYDESFAGGSPRLKVSRRYSIVPRQAGSLDVPGPQLHWWDVAQGAARTAQLPPLALTVAAARPGSAAPPAPTPIDTQAALPDQAVGDAVPVSPSAPATWPWPWLALAAGLVVLWLLTLWWGWRRGRGPRSAGGTPPDGAGTAAGRGLAATPAVLRQALDADGFDAIERVLCTMAGVARLEQVIERLADPRQRELLQQLQEARWGGQGDLPGLRQHLRAAFRDGPRWVPAGTAADTALAPLYPPPRR